MTTNFQSSFIPKEPITEEVFKKKKAGIFGVLAFSLFITSIVVAGAMFVYKSILQNEIKDLELQLVESEKNIDRKTINDMSQFSKKLEAVKSIVTKHQVMSNFLSLLASSTVSSVHFTNFDYRGLVGREFLISLDGKAQSYANIALQEEILSKDKNFKTITFSDLNLDDKGLVSFSLSVSIDPQILNYIP